MSADADFDRWSAPNLIDTGPPARTAAVRAWLQEVFDAEGPIDDAQLVQRAVERQLALAREAVDLVMRDQARSVPGVDLDVAVDTYDGSLRISVDGSFETPSMMEWERAAAIAEVASYLQEYICEEVGGCVADLFRARSGPSCHHTRWRSRVALHGWSAHGDDDRQSCGA